VQPDLSKLSETRGFMKALVGIDNDRILGLAINGETQDEPVGQRWGKVESAL
jgi:hypothetical protein